MTAPRQAGPLTPTLEQLAVCWRERATDLREWAHAEGAAAALEHAAAELEAAIRTAADDRLTLEQASAACCYSADHLRHLVADGTIPNAGRRGAPRIRRGDLPKRPGARATTSTYDADADALRLVQGAR